MYFYKIVFGWIHLLRCVLTFVIGLSDALPLFQTAWFNSFRENVCDNYFSDVHILVLECQRTYYVPCGDGNLSRQLIERNSFWTMLWCRIPQGNFWDIQVNPDGLVSKSDGQGSIPDRGRFKQTEQIFLHRYVGMIMFFWVLVPSRCRRFGETLAIFRTSFQPWSWRVCVYPKRWLLTTSLNGPRTRESNTIVLTAVKIANLIHRYVLHNKF